jgi:hypothetical protein
MGLDFLTFWPSHRRSRTSRLFPPLSAKVGRFSEPSPASAGTPEPLQSRPAAQKRAVASLMPGRHPAGFVGSGRPG